MDLLAALYPFVNLSAIFDIRLFYLIFTTPVATFNFTKWYAIELCFLFNVDSNLELLSTTLMFSFKVLDSPSMGILNILNLKLNAMIVSTHVFSSINSIPNVLDSSVA